MAKSAGSQRVGGVYFEIEGDNTDFKRELRQSELSAKRAGNVISAEFRKTEVAAAAAEKRIRGVSTSLIAFAAGASVAIGQSVSILKDFGQAMSTVQAVTGATEAQMVALTAQARLLGATTRFSATQAAEGMIFLARAGFNTDQVLGSIEGTLQLAQAGALELADAADIASNVLQGMRLPVSETSRVVDVLAKAANSSNTNVRQLGDALKYVAPIASGLGVGIEETVAAIGALSDAGLQGETAGTGLRRVMIGLEKQTPQGEKVLKKYGLSMSDVSVQSNGLVTALKRLADAGINTADAMTLFGLRGGPAVAVLTDSVDKIDKQTAALNKAGGTVENVARIMDDNLNGAILAAISALQELVLAMGEAGATPALIASFNGLANLFRTVAKNADVLGVAMVALATRAMIPLVVSTVPRVLAGLAALQASLAATTTIAGRTAVAMSVVGGPATLAIAAAAAAYLYLARSTVTADEALNNFNDTLGKIAKTREDIAADTEKLAKINDTLTASIEGQGSAAELTARKEINAINTRIAKNKELLALYETQARANLATVEQAIIREQQSLAKSLDTFFSGGLAGPAQGEEALNKQIDQFLEFVRRQQDAGIALDKFDTKLLDQVSAFRTYQAEADKARESIANLSNAFDGGSGVLVDLNPDEITQVVSTEFDIKSAALNDYSLAQLEKVLNEAQKAGSKELVVEIQKEINSRLEALSTMERAAALESARARGNEELVAILERGEEAIARTADYLAIGLEKEEARARVAKELVDLAASEAEAKANAAKDAAAIARYEQFREGQKKRIEEEKAVQQAFEQSISQALNSAVRTGDWGSAVRDVFADAVSQGLSNAIADFATELVNLIGSALKGSGGGSIGSFFASLFDFGGGRAAGGSVNAGERYLIGERGPEMFVPNQSGVIVPNSMLNPNTDTSSVRAGGNAQMNFIVQGNITEEVFPRVQQMFADFARQVPGMVDARVVDRKKRGAY